jgi:NHL repeat-containing protein
LTVGFTSVWRGGRHRAARLVAALGMLVLALLAGSGSAQALLQRGHVSAGMTIGTLGGGSGQLKEPSAVAVNESTGNLYVADRGNNRIEQFKANGEFVSVFANVKGAKVAHPEAIAVDNSHQGNPGEDPSAGDVYVVQSGHVFKYDAEGKYLATLIEKEQKEEFGAPEGVAVDQQGQVWLIFAEDEVVTFDDGRPNMRLSEETFESELEPVRSGLGVDSHDDLYVRYEPAEASEEGTRGCRRASCFAGKLSGLGEPLRELSPGEPLIVQEDGENTSGLGVDETNDDVYLNNVTSLAAFDSTGQLIQRFGSGVLKEGTGVTVDAKTDTVYAADAQTGTIDVFEPAPAGPPTIDSVDTHSVSTDEAQLEAQIDPVGSTTSYFVQYSTAPCTGSATSCGESFSCASGPATCGQLPQPAGSLASGFGAQLASVALGGLAPGTTYYVRFVAQNEDGRAISEEHSFLTPPEAGLTLVDGRAWELVSPAEKFGNQIEPIRREGGLVQASISGNAVTYVANGAVSRDSAGNRGPEPNQVFSSRDPVLGWSAEDITTPNTEATGVNAGHQGGEYRVFSSNLALSIVEPFDKNRFAAPPLSPALTEREKTEGQERTLYVRADAPVTPEGSEQSTYEQAQKNGKALGNAGFLALVTDVDAPGVMLNSTTFSQTLKFAGATPDLSHVVFDSKVPLTSPSPGSGEQLYEWAAGILKPVSVLPASETGAGAPTLGYLGTSVSHAISDDGSRIFWTSGSSGGGFLYMRDMAGEQTTRIDVVDPEEAQQGVVATGPEKPEFQTASADGSRVLFTDTQKLVSGASAAEKHPDLYAYDVAARKLEDLTVDHTTDAHKIQEHADVKELLLGASDDATNVYFAANGILDTTENARHERAIAGNCSAELREGAEGKCNLYFDHYNGTSWDAPKFIATVSNEDGADWERGHTGIDYLSRHTAGTSPDGDYLAFMSDTRLTGYDNTDANSAHADEEVFLYSTRANRIVCASCNPSGARPKGVHDVEGSGEGIGLLVDRPQAWIEEQEENRLDNWLAGSLPGWTPVETEYTYYRSRYLSDSGRLFFNSPDALSSQDVNGKEDVYEYEPEGVPRGQHSCADSSATFSAAAGGCVGLVSSGTGSAESTFLDAGLRGGENADGSDRTEGGGDVFFLTAAPLALQDSDTNFDIYDAHECTTASPCVHPTSVTTSPCGDEASCKAPYSPPLSSAPAPAGGASSGNVTTRSGGSVLGNKTVVTKPLSRAQKLAKALKACKKLKQKKRRPACEKVARKKYGTKAKAKHKSSKRGKK